MTRRITFTVVGALAAMALAAPSALAMNRDGEALLSVVPATSGMSDASDRAKPDVTSGSLGAFERALIARGEELDRTYGLGKYAAVDSHQRADRVDQSVPGWQRALVIRSEALNAEYGLGSYAPVDSHQRALTKGDELTATPTPDAFERAVAQGRPSVVAADSHQRFDPGTPVSVPAVTSGSEVEWPQIGIGFGVAILLGIGVFAAMRLTRIRPVAH
jgi:hypothetical protein